MTNAAEPVAEQPMPAQTDVFVSGSDGYRAYRIPVIETASDGSLLAFAEARKHNLGDPGTETNDIDLVCKRSSDAGRTWSAMKVIEDPGELWSAANAATVVDRQTGRVWLHYLRCKPGKNTDAARPGTDDVQNLVRTSDDNGQTWSDPIDLTSVARDMKDPNWRCSVPGPGGAIQDQENRLIVPIWKVAPADVLAIFSEDHGKTWTTRGKPSRMNGGSLTSRRPTPTSRFSKTRASESSGNARTTNSSPSRASTFRGSNRSKPICRRYTAYGWYWLV